MPRLGPAHASPSTLNTLFHTLSCTAFSIASAAVDNRPKDPAPTVVLENQIGRVLDNQDPVRMDICAAATTICPAEPCESPLRNRKCQGRSRLKMPTYGAGGGDFQNGASRPQDRFCRNILRDKDGMRAGTMGTGAPQKNEDCKHVDIGHRTESLRTRYRCRISCAATSVNTLRWCAARAMGAAAGGAYGGDIPGSYSLAYCPVGADRA